MNFIERNKNLLEKVVPSFPSSGSSNHSEDSGSGPSSNSRERVRTPSPKTFQLNSKKKQEANPRYNPHEKKRYQDKLERRYQPGIRCSFGNCSCNCFLEQVIDEEQLWRVQKIGGEEAALYVNKKQISTCARTGCGHGDIWHRQTQYVGKGSFNVINDGSNRLSISKHSDADSSDSSFIDVGKGVPAVQTLANIPGDKSQNASLNSTSSETDNKAHVEGNIGESNTQNKHLSPSETNIVNESVRHNVSVSATQKKKVKVPQRSVSSYN